MNNNISKESNKKKSRIIIPDITEIENLSNEF